MPKYYRHPRYFHVYGDPIATPIARFAWPSLVTPKDPPPPQPGQAPGNPRFELTLLFDNDSAELAQFLQTVEDMTAEMLKQFNEGRSAKLGELRTIQDGNAFDAEKYPYYQGKLVLVARNTQRPQIVGTNPKEAVEPEKIVGGVQGKAVVTPLITSHGVSYKLSVVQYLEDDGVRFGGGVRDMTSFLSAVTTDDTEIDAGDEEPAPVAPVAAKPAAAKVVRQAVAAAKPAVAPKAPIPAEAAPKKVTPADLRAAAAKKPSKGMSLALDKL